MEASNAELLMAMLWFGVLVAISIGIYAIPTFIAGYRNHPNVAPIAIVNVLLGWTFIGWVAALVWSLTAFTRTNADE